MTPAIASSIVRNFEVGASERCTPALPRIPGYQVRRRVGKGRMSTAYLAQDLRRGGDVVLKIPNAGHAGDPARRVSFAQEFAIPSLIGNEHVVRMFDQCVGCDGCSYLAMEYLEGGDVGGWIRRGLTAQEAVSLLRQAAVALSELHHRGFVHRDVKPANLLLRSSGDLVLADFGLACRIGAMDIPSHGTVVGTPCYAAPEQMQGAAAGPAADVYSLGIVFYEMLCGAPPFTGSTAMELQCQHLMAAVPGLPPGLARFQPSIDAMLEKDPHRRLSDGAAVLRQIDLINHPDLPVNGADGATASRC
jgi:serine/threonine protein kinase